MTEQAVPFLPQEELTVTYKGKRLKTAYKPDFMVDEKVIVEIKALARLTGIEEAQTINYLKATGYQIGLLINFGARSLE